MYSAEAVSAVADLCLFVFSLIFMLGMDQYTIFIGHSEINMRNGWISKFTETPLK